MICVMQVCNETGVIMPIAEIARAARPAGPQGRPSTWTGCRASCVVPFSLKKLGVQSYALSGHKIHGPKGVGALVWQDGFRFRPQIVGGGQQDDLRSGTENTCGIAGLRAAVETYPADGYGAYAANEAAAWSACFGKSCRRPPWWASRRKMTAAQVTC